MGAGIPGNVGPYEILGELGRGGMGAVYHARHRELGRECALKVILEGANASDELEGRFRREAQAAARLAQHPGIVGVHDAGEDAGQLYIAMDLVDGRALDDVLNEEPPRPREAAAWIAEAARAVAHANAHGVIHRDIKPGNILLTAGGQVRVTDFGLAGLIEADAAVTKLTRTGVVIGTPSYMPPEQALGRADDPRVDVYALGATLYELLCLQPPFEGLSTVAVLAAVLRRAPTPLRRLNPAIPAPLETIALRCLEKEPAHRYPTADALADDLERFLAGQRIGAVRPGVGRRAWRAVRRRPAAAVAVTGLALALGLGTWWTVRTQQAASEAQSSTQTATTERTLEERAAPIAAAYYGLTLKSVEPFRLLEDHRHGRQVSSEALQAAVSQIEETAGEVSAQFPDAQVPAAWLGVARIFAGDDERGRRELAAAVEAAHDDPFPRLLSAWVALSDYNRVTQVMPIQIGTKDVRVAPFRESPAARALREQAAALVAPLESLPVWPHLEHGQELLQFVRGAKALANEHLEEAIADTAALGELPLLGTDACLLHATALMQAGRFGDVPGALAAPLAREWADATHVAARAALAHWVELEPDSPAGPAQFEQADRLAQSAAALAPRVSEAHLTVAVLHHTHGRRLARAGEDPLAAFEAGCVAFSRYAEAAGGRPSAAKQASMAWKEFGDELLGRKRDPRRALETALRFADQCVAANPGDPRALDYRAMALHALGTWEEQSGRDPRSLWDTAREALDQALAADSTDFGARHHRAQMAVAYGEFLRRRKEDPSAVFKAGVADFTELLRRNPDTVWILQDLARLHHGLATHAGANTEGYMYHMREAIAVSRRYAEHVADNPAAWKALATRCTTYAIGRQARGEKFEKAFAETIDAYDRYLAAGGDKGFGYYYRALARTMLGHARAATKHPKTADAYAAAIKDFELTREVTPDNTTCVLWIATCLAGMDRLDEAIALTKRHIAEVDDSPAAKKFLANLEKRKRR